MKQTTYDVYALLETYNVGNEVRLGARPCTGGYKLTFDYWENGIRQRCSLKMTITGLIKNQKQDDVIIKQAITLRNQKQLQIDTGLYIPEVKSTNAGIKFNDYCNSIFKDMTPKQKGYYEMVVKLFIRYAGKNVIITKIKPDAIKKFFDGMDVGNTTRHNYAFCLKHMFAFAVKDKLISDNPVADIRYKMDDVHRSYLTIEEIQSLFSDGTTQFKLVKEMVLLSAYTGLRRSDLFNLQWDNIKDGILTIKQQKTKDIVTMKLHPVALEILNSIPHTHNRVFANAPTYKYVRLGIDELIQSAGINKHITLHCFRHTFATLLLSNNVNIYTVSKLMGHRDISTTMLYSHLIDSVRDAAIDCLPTIQ